jgi:predicted transposase/invertase (TIGR01784 family)
MFEEAVDMITEFTKEQKLRHAYDMRENYERIVQSYIHTGFLDGLEKGKQDGFQDGLEKGKQDGFQDGLEKGSHDGYLKGRSEVAKKMKAAGLTLQQITELTGLGAAEVAGL